MRKISIFLIMFLVMISCAFAVPPVLQTGQESGELEIVYPKFEYFKQPSSAAANLTLHFHLYNSSGYLRTDAVCLFHLYNHSDNHLINTNLSKDSNGQDYLIRLNGSVLNYLGVYSYIINCNNSVESGFLSNYFIINSQGEKADNGLNNLAVFIALGLLALILIVIYWVIDNEHWLMKLVLIMAIPLILLNLGSIAAELTLGTFIEMQGLVFYKITLWILRIFYTYVIIALAYTSFIQIANLLKKHKKV